MGNPIPDEALFFISDQQYTITQLINTLYDKPSPEAQAHFIATNSHLRNKQVLPGQMVIITPPDSSSCQRWESMMQQAALEVDKELAQMTEKERKVLANHYAVLSNVATVTAPMYGWTNSYFAQKSKMVEHTLKQIERLYISTYKQNGHLRNPNFFSQRKALFVQLDQAINGMMEKQLFGENIPANKLKSELGLSSKAIVHQWKTQGNTDSLKGFSSNYAKLAKVAKNFSRLGYVSMALDVAGGAANIKEACTLAPDSPSCDKAKFVEPAKVTGSIGGGMFGGAVATYLTCNLIFGIETFGTSLLWCSVVAGAAGGYGGSKLGGSFGKDAGELIYKAAN